MLKTNLSSVFYVMRILLYCLFGILCYGYGEVLGPEFWLGLEIFHFLKIFLSFFHGLGLDLELWFKYFLKFSIFYLKIFIFIFENFSKLFFRS